MTAAEVLQAARPGLILGRAFAAGGKKIAYTLGRGGREPLASSPADHDGSCDCSGYVAWCVGLDRYQPRSRLLAKYNGGWISTTAIVYDANRPRAESGWFTRIAVPELAAIVAYPDKTVAGKKTQGHVGILTRVPAGAIFPAGVIVWDMLRVIHCSSSNFRRTGDAVQETDAALFGRAGAIICRFDP